LNFNTRGNISSSLYQQPGLVPLDGQLKGRRAGSVDRGALGDLAPTELSAPLAAMSRRTSPGDAAYTSPWLHAHYDKLASIKTSSAGVALLDLDGSGEHALLCADYDDKLRVFKGTRQASEHPLVDVPVAVCGFRGSTRVIQRRFNVSVPRARVSETAPTLRERSER
jgi:hypothetical protein